MKEFYQLKYDLFLFYYPLFHYSNIPVIDESGGSLNSYLFNRCRNSDTLKLVRFDNLTNTRVNDLKNIEFDEQ